MSYPFPNFCWNVLPGNWSCERNVRRQALKTNGRSRMIECIKGNSHRLKKKYDSVPSANSFNLR